METWSVHHLFQEAIDKLDDEQACQVQRYAARLIGEGLPVIFSLRHLAKITGTDYDFLHDTVDRRRDGVNYRMFTITKRSGGRRFIHAVSGKLLAVQQFINSEILQRTQPHSASFAFHPSGGIRKCAAQHCGAGWLFQFDLADFFFSIPESRVYNSFCQLGYRPLLAFELARICTTTHLPKYVRLKRSKRKNSCDSGFLPENKNCKRFPYTPQWSMGVLPQGAPTSPMLSNLATRQLDEVLHKFAREQGFVYTRYADDLTLSSSRLPTGVSAGTVRRNIIDLIRKNGFVENRGKIRLAGPGARKVVLGLLVDGERPRLSKQMYKRIDRHLYASEKFGIAKTAVHWGFESAYGFYNHLCGLIAFTKDVDPKQWDKFSSRLHRIPAPV